MLSHLVYVSSRNPNCTDEEIDKILAACQRNNEGMNVTGVLLYSKKQFVQYIEGEQNEIKFLYDKIKKDDRHSNVVMITNAPIDKRHFPSWQMASKKIDFDQLEFKTEMNYSDLKEFKNVLSGKSEEGTRALHLMKKLFN